jgi:hypothetical protein
LCSTVDEASSWAEVVHARKGKEVTLDELSASLLCTLFPCIWCINDKEIRNLLSWKQEWEVLDELKDEVYDTVQWEGEDGLKLLWGLYAKSPTNDDVKKAKEEAMASIARKQEEDDAINMSLKCKFERAQATNSLRKQSLRMEKRAKKADGGGDIQEGDVVLIPVSDHDKGKLDRRRRLIITELCAKKDSSSTFTCTINSLGLLALPITVTFMGWRKYTPVGEGYQRCRKVQ